jgi:hypothetical protein
MARTPNPVLDALASEAYSDYLVACNVTDSFDHFHAPTMSPVHPLFELARSLENSRAEAANYVMSAAYGDCHRPITVDGLIQSTGSSAHLYNQSIAASAGDPE